MPGSVAEILAPTLGGIPQWVMIRGRSKSNPVLIVLHGGPGMPETGLLRHFNAPLEDHFTVVYWEQRGAGRTFTANTPASSMTIAQFVSDLDALVDVVRARLGKDKVALLGHSWGSALGTLYAAQHSDKVSAYIGVGQIGNLQKSEEASYAFVLAEAQKRGNRKAVAALEKIGRPPHAPDKLMIQRRWLGRFAGMFGSLPLLTAIRAARSAPEASLFDLPAFFRGMMFSLKPLWPQVAALDLPKQVPALAMPVWFLLGRHDHQVDAQVAADDFETLAAPEKSLVWFEGSGHFVPFEEPDAFNAQMAQIAATLR